MMDRTVYLCLRLDAFLSAEESFEPPFLPTLFPASGTGLMIN